jgi:hypothetical protein
MLNQACEVSFIVEWKMWKGYYIVMSTITISSTGSRSSLEQCGAGINRLRCGWWAHSDCFSFKKVIHDQWGISAVILSPPTLPFYLQAVEMNIVTWHWWRMFVAICLSDWVGDTAPVVTVCQVSGQAEPYVIFWEKTGTLETHPGTFEKCLGQSRHFSDPFWQTFWECLRNVWVSHGQPTKFW